MAANKRAHLPINQYDLDGKYIQTFDNAQAAADALGKNFKTTIQSVASYTRASAHGFIWRYVEDEKKLGTEHSKNYNKEHTAAVTQWKSPFGIFNSLGLNNNGQG